MRVNLLRQNLESSRRLVSYQTIVLLMSLSLNAITASIAWRLVGHERTIVVPPAINKSFWVDSEKVSAEYLEQMGYFLLQLVLNVTPQSVDYQSKLVIHYAAPASYGDLKTAMAVAAERLKRDGAATVFSARSVSVDDRRLKVSVQGQLTTFISDRRVSEATKSYVVELQYGLGRLTIKSLKETNANDSLDNKTSAAVSTARA